MNDRFNATPSRRKIFGLPVACATLIYFFVVTAGEAARAEDTVIGDPLFSLGYDNRNVHFDQLPTKELLPACKRSLSPIEPLPPRLTLYARYITASTRVYIAGPSDFIRIFVIRGEECHGGVPDLALLRLFHDPPEPGDTPVLSNQEVFEVFSDAVSRYARAFGGKERFIQWLDTSTERATRGCNGPEKLCGPTYRAYGPELQKVLDSYRAR